MALEALWILYCHGKPLSISEGCLEYTGEPSGWVC